MYRVVTGLVLWAVAIVAQAQDICDNLNTSMRPITPDSRFQAISGNEALVLDKQTGLVWQRCYSGFSLNTSTNTCEVTGDAFWTWQGALAEAVATGTEWRVPNIKELSSIVERACTDPAINQIIFPTLLYPYGFWTSSPVAQLDSLAPGAGGTTENRVWAISFQIGQAVASDKTAGLYLRLVRDATAADVAP